MMKVVIEISKFEERIGKQKINKDGLLMEIISYNNAMDMNVKFLESGSIRKHVQYNAFKRGVIKDPLNKKKTYYINKERIGLINTNNKNKKMKIINYRSSSDIDVKFLDSGYIAKHKKYTDFKYGSIADEDYQYNNKKTERINLIGTNKKGLKMKIINYENCSNMDVKFLESGNIRKHVSYRRFQQGSILDKKEEEQEKLFD